MTSTKADSAHADTPVDASVSLGKGAWDCDARREIPPELEAKEFEELPTMDFPFEGIPTIPPRKDMSRMAFFCNGCRYRVTAFPDWPVEKVKQALWNGGIERSNKQMRNTPGLRQWDDMSLIYAGQIMKNTDMLSDYAVPLGCQCLIAVETARLYAQPEPGSSYWN